MNWKRSDGAEALKSELVQLYQPFYQINDRAHQIAHVITVTDEAMEINRVLELGLDDCILVGAAMTHDLFNTNREMHHDLVRMYLLTNSIYWMREFSEKERMIMAAAAGEHRASYKGEYTSMYSEVVSAADRGRPNDRSAVIRCAVYGFDKSGYTGVALFNHVMSHMREKYGTSGYARYPDLYTKFYSESLSKFQATMEHLNAAEIELFVADHPIAKHFHF